jgi:hypothetical protein
MTVRPDPFLPPSLPEEHNQEPRSLRFPFRLAVLYPVFAFVIHGITEEVFLGTKVVVLTAGPARMADEFEIALPHPRHLDIKTEKGFSDYSRRVYKLLGME